MHLQAAVDAWGERGLLELEAEERLSFACEKSPTQDSVITKLRDVFRVSTHGTALCVQRSVHALFLSNDFSKNRQGGPNTVHIITVVKNVKNSMLERLLFSSELSIHVQSLQSMLGLSMVNAVAGKSYFCVHNRHHTYM